MSSTTSRRFISVLAAVAITGSVVAAQPATAAVGDHPPVIGYIANTTAPGRFQEPQQHADGDIDLQVAVEKLIEVAYPQSQGASSLEFSRADGEALQLGVNTRTNGSRFEVLDLAVDGSGAVTRFDIRFPVGAADPVDAVFGEVRMGQSDETPVRFAGRHLSWPQTPVNGTRVWVEQAVHNAGTTPERLGRAALVGSQATDFALADDACSGTVLAAGATCTVRVGYSPKHGGPRLASLVLMAGGEQLTASLAGTAPLGVSRLTVSGNNFIALNKTRTDKDGPEVMLTGRPDTSAAVFTAGRTYETYDAATRLDLIAPYGTALKTGTFRVSDEAGSQQLDISRESRACNGTEGTEKISELAFGPDGRVERAHVTFSVRCGNDTRPGLVKGELLWRHRGDVTPPKGPSALELVGTATHTVTWRPSRSSDAVTTIVRLVPGDGTDATPTSGYTVGDGKSGSAEILGLPTGKRFTVMAWAVDATGNVSNALRRGFTS